MSLDEVGFAFLRENFDSNDVTHPLHLDAGTKVFFRYEEEKYVLIAYSMTSVLNETTFEFRVPISPPITTSEDIFVIPSPPPSPPPSPTSSPTGNSNSELPLRL